MGAKSSTRVLSQPMRQRVDYRLTCGKYPTVIVWNANSNEPLPPHPARPKLRPRAQTARSRALRTAIDGAETLADLATVALEIETGWPAVPTTVITQESP